MAQAAPAARRARSAGGPPGVALEPRLPGRPSGASGRRAAEPERGCCGTSQARVGGSGSPRGAAVPAGPGAARGSGGAAGRGGRGRDAPDRSSASAERKGRVTLAWSERLPVPGSAGRTRLPQERDEEPGRVAGALPAAPG